VSSPLQTSRNGCRCPAPAALRARKLNGILNALIMQIEDGGDNPEVNDLLLAALRAGVLHQVGERQAQPVLSAIDAFSVGETERRQQAAAGTPPPTVLSPLKQLEELSAAGYKLTNQGQSTAACDQWQAAWEVVQSLLTPAMRSTAAFDRQYPRLQWALSDWMMEFMFELHNAGLSQAVYHERRLRYVHELLARFPDEDDDRYLEFRRGEVRPYGKWARRPSRKRFSPRWWHNCPTKAGAISAGQITITSWTTARRITRGPRRFCARRWPNLIWKIGNTCSNGCRRSMRGLFNKRVIRGDGA